MAPVLKTYKAAAVNAEPGWFDLEESVRRTIHWINEAGKAGCKLITFPELWIPGYPYWAWKVTYQESLPLLKAYRENSLASDSDEMRRIRVAARTNKIFVSLGYSELDLASLYTTQVLISPSGEVINHRRKIRATHVERLVFGDGTGDTTESVVQTEIGRVGHLNCWENMNPFMKAYAASLGEQVHVAAWPLYPGQETLKYPDPFTNVAEANCDVFLTVFSFLLYGRADKIVGDSGLRHRNRHVYPGTMAGHHGRGNQAQHTRGQGARGSKHLQRTRPHLWS